MTNASIPFCWLMASIKGKSSGRVPVSAFNQWMANWGRLFTVFGQTLGKFVIEQKFCVTAIVVSKFITTCHHPEGTNITWICKIWNLKLERKPRRVSEPHEWPGIVRWANVGTGLFGRRCWTRWRLRPDGDRPPLLLAWPIALAPMDGLGTIWQWGMSIECNLKFAYFLWPEMSAFHADVPNGSIWIPVPERAGPITNHLYTKFIKNSI